MAEDSLAQLKIAYQQFRQGNLASAEQTFHAVLRRDPTNVHALNLLGILHRQSGQPAQAIEYLQQALAINGDDSQAHSQIGLAYKDLNQIPRACIHLEKASELTPSPENLNNYGNLLRANGDTQKAMAVLHQVVTKAPGFAEAWSNYAAALKDARQLRDALAAVNKALRINSSLPESFNLRGEILQQQGHYARALEDFQTASRLNPDSSSYLVNSARALRDMNQPLEALAHLDHALKISPDHVQARYIQGLLHEQLGDSTEAARCYHALLACKPDMARAHHQLVQLKGHHYSEDSYQQLFNAWQSGQLDHQEKLYSCYVFYRWLEQRAEYDEAFRWLQQGNALSAAQSNLPVTSAGEAHKLLVQQTLAITTSNRRPTSGKIPVFVVGLPRSGTSLTEQMLASHSQIEGIGEQHFAQSMAEESERLTGKPFPFSLPTLSESEWHQLGDGYLEQVGHIHGAYVVDKTPLNFQYIGMLATALPNARFLHCHRNPVSNGFAIYRLPFDSSQHYAHDLIALGQYYRDYWQLMEHWKALYPSRILNICYEDTVSNTEQQARSLLEFLGLDFEPSILQFHDTIRLVTTPSASQVRQPIYQGALNSWVPYRQQLAPLMAALGDLCPQ